MVEENKIEEDAATVAEEDTEEEATMTSPEGDIKKLCPNCTELLKDIFEKYGASLTSIGIKVEEEKEE